MMCASLTLQRKLNPIQRLALGTTTPASHTRDLTSGTGRPLQPLRRWLLPNARTLKLFAFPRRRHDLSDKGKWYQRQAQIREIETCALEDKQRYGETCREMRKKESWQRDTGIAVSGRGFRQMIVSQAKQSKCAVLIPEHRSGSRQSPCCRFLDRCSQNRAPSLPLTRAPSPPRSRAPILLLGVALLLYWGQQQSVSLDNQIGCPDMECATHTQETHPSSSAIGIGRARAQRHPPLAPALNPHAVQRRRGRTTVITKP